MSWFGKIKEIFRFKRSAKFFKEPNLNDTATTNAPWWGNYIIEEEQSRFFKIANIVLCLDRYSNEWHITSYKDIRGAVDLPTDTKELASESTYKLLKSLPQNVKPYKTLSAYTTNEISLRPTLPDRPLLTALAHPYYIPSNQSLLIYVRYPIWILIKAGKPEIYLDEIPTQVISDSWFGIDTMSGELCYEAKTESATRLEDLSMDTTHVITPIRIENRSKETLVLQELKIPLPVLSIFCDLDNQLWTEEITISQESFHFANVTVGKPSKILKDGKCLTPSRFNAKSSFRDLFSSFTGK